MRSLVLCSVLLGLSACYFDQRDDDDRREVHGPPPDASSCPAISPTAGASCNAPAGDTCRYLIEECACGPSDIEWTFSCESGAWYGTRGYDCYPCPDAGIPDAYYPPDAFIPS